MQFGYAFNNQLGELKSWAKGNVHKVNNMSPDRHQTLLYIASRGGHLAMVKFLVEECLAIVNQPNGDNGMKSTPLHGAAYGGHLDVIQYLMSKGADPSLKNTYGETPRTNAKIPADGVTKTMAKKCIEALDVTPMVVAAVSPKKATAVSPKKASPPAPAPAPVPAAAPPPPPLPAPAPEPPSPPKAAAPPPLPAPAPSSSPSKKVEGTPAATGPLSLKGWTFTAGDLLAKGIAELRSMCSKVGLATSGTKSALADRLVTAASSSSLDSEGTGSATTAPSPGKKAPSNLGKGASGKPEEEAGGGDDAPDAKKSKKEAETAATTTEGSPVASGLDDAWIAKLREAKFSMKEVDRDTEDFWTLEEKVMACNQGRNDDYVKNRLKKKQKPLTFIVKKAWKVKNAVLDEAFEAKRKELIATRGDESVGRVRTAFHGTREGNIDNMLKTSLLRFKHPLNPCKDNADDGYFGTNRKGVYVSRYFDYTLKYSNGLNPLEENESVKIIMFKCLPGRTFHVTSLNMGMDPTPGHDSHSSPSHLEWYLFDERQLVPDYILQIEAKVDTRTAADDE